METVGSIFLIIGGMIVVVVLVWIFGQVLVMGARGGGTGSGHKHSGGHGNWEAHLAALQMEQPDYLRSNDNEYKQWEYVGGDETTVDGVLVEEYEERDFSRQLGSGR